MLDVMFCVFEHYFWHFKTSHRDMDTREINNNSKKNIKKNVKRKKKKPKNVDMFYTVKNPVDFIPLTQIRRRHQ